MKNIEINNNGLFVNGKHVPIISGEFHYWRTAPEAWENVLKSMKELGFNMVSTYIPWDFHEYKKGSFDFAGKVSAHRDLIGWLELCKKSGFSVIIKPGPYIYAEWNLGGPPDYAFKHPKLSKEFLEFTEVWIKNVSKALKPFLATNGGPIIMLQACNEVVGHYEYSDFDDPKYGKIDEIYKKYIREKFPKIGDFNKAAGKNYKDFSKVALPKIKATWGGGTFRDIDIAALPTTINECKLLIEFGKWYTESYLAEITALYRKYGIDVPIFANLVGWYWPQDWERIEKVMDLESLDTYYQNLLPADLYFAFTKLYKTFCAASKFPVAAEFQSGVWDPMIKQTGVLSERHFYFTTMTAMACGLKGINYYMLVNRDNWYFAPVNEWGKVRADARKVVTKTAALLNKLSPENLKRTSRLGVAWYRGHSEHFLFTGKKQNHLDYKHKDISKMSFAEDYPQCWELYRAITRDGIDAGIVSLTGDGKWPGCLVYGGYPFMEWPVAEKLYRHVTAGGKLIVSGTLPETDMSGENRYDLFKDLLKNLRTFRAKGVYSIRCGKGAIYFAPEGMHNWRDFLKETGYTEDIYSGTSGVYTSIHENVKSKKQLIFVTNPQRKLQHITAGNIPDLTLGVRALNLADIARPQKMLFNLFRVVPHIHS